MKTLLLFRGTFPFILAQITMYLKNKVHLNFLGGGEGALIPSNVKPADRCRGALNLLLSKNKL